MVSNYLFYEIKILLNENTVVTYKSVIFSLGVVLPPSMLLFHYKTTGCFKDIKEMTFVNISSLKESNTSWG